MAEALINVLLERLAMLSLEKIERELKMVAGVKQEVRNLTLRLEAIRAVLEDAEQRQEMDARVKLWLDELKDVSFDMDDVLDEWITRVLKHQLENKQEKPSASALATTKKKQVCFPGPFPSSCFHFRQVNQLFLRHEIGAKIKELNERLALIDQNKQSFGFQNTTRVPELPQRQITTSLPNVKTFGREKEKTLIVSKLLNNTSEGNEVPLIVPIVGMGGMGKTTLAQLVYNDESVKSHFDKRIWVCVSDPFEEIKIAQAIIEEIDIDNVSKNSNVLQTLTQCIYRLIEGKKFLIVLDDVWSPNSHQWEELIKPLRSGAIGSRILVTTRKKDVSTLMKATTELIHLKELGEAFCLSLFYYNADIDESNVSNEFKDIGSEIVKRCNGLPLAAKTLGSLMRNKKKIHEWKAVLNSKTWELKMIQQDVFRPLLLSYQDLTPTTKHCLLYCVIFPKDHVYNKNNLVELWMSQDYLNPKESENKERTCQTCFDDLVMRSFFQDIEVDNENGNITCKIHDIVHDFLQYLTQNECLSLDLELDGSERKEVLRNDKIRHLTVHASENDCLISFLSNFKKLRTLIAIDSSDNSTSSMFEVIAQLKCLRTLSLWPRRRNNGFIEIPETLGGLIHLRYLDLSGNDELVILPSAIGSLYNLQTLRLVGCCGLKKLDVGRLINLRHLYVERCGARRSIKGIENLKHLQTLDEFLVGDHKKNDGQEIEKLTDLQALDHEVTVLGDKDEENKLESLKDLNQLQGSLFLEIRGRPKMEENNNAGAIMVDKIHLLELRLEFFQIWKELEQREIMNVLEPHAGLESLSIRGYRGSIFSNWLTSLHGLRVLTLVECPDCKNLPPLGELASLESLRIEGLHGVEKVGVEFLALSSSFKSFPKLKHLTIDFMPSWEEWEGVEEVEENSDEISIMPCLSHLIINECEKLKALPDFLWKTPIQKLEIGFYSPFLGRLYRPGRGEGWAKISHIPSIDSRY